MSDKTEIKTWSESEPWEYSDSYTSYAVTGVLAEKIQARAGKTGAVTMLDVDQQWGTCEICGGYGFSLKVMIGGETVYEGGESDDMDGENAVSLEGTTYAKFEAWLNGEED